MCRQSVLSCVTTNIPKIPRSALVASGILSRFARNSGPRHGSSGNAEARQHEPGQRQPDRDEGQEQKYFSHNE